MRFMDNFEMGYGSVVSPLKQLVLVPPNRSLLMTAQFVQEPNFMPLAE